MARLLIVIILVQNSCGCISVVIDKCDFDESTFQKPKDPPAFFNIPRLPINIKFDEITQNQTGTVMQFRFQSWQEKYHANDSINGEISYPKHPKSSDVFLILPGMIGNMSANRVSQHLVSIGYQTIRVNSDFSPIPDNVIEQAEKQTTAKAAIEVSINFCRFAFQRHIIGLMCLLDELDKGKIFPQKQTHYHIIGISLGGIVGSLLAAVDYRVKSIMMVLSSGHISRIVISRMMSAVEGIQAIRSLLIGKFGLDYDQAHRLIEEKLKDIEPTNYANRINPKRMLMISGGLDMLGIVDSAMPLKASYLSWEKFGKPEWIILPFTGHFSSYIFFISPFWLEISNKPHHVILSLICPKSYFEHILKHHYLPKALN